jgi:NDP-sugar pyrophosphorylase family protein
VDKAVILAAGRGTRMGALTAGVPKPMLRVAGRPVLEHVLERLGAGGFRRFAVVTGYRAGMIEAHLAAWPAPVTFLRQERPDGTASAALLAEGFAGADGFLLTYGDILADPDDYRAVAAALEPSAETEGVLAVQHTGDPWKGAAVYEAGGRISRIVEKPAPGSSATHWNSAGIYALRPTVFGYLRRVGLSDRGEYEIPSALNLMLDEGRRLVIHPLSGFWMDVGRPDDLEQAGRALR